MPQFQDEQEVSSKKSAICQQVQEDLAKLVLNIENMMSNSRDENSSQETNEILFAS